MSAKPATVLLVEDDVVLRKLFTTILSVTGYRVHAVEDGFAALAKIGDGLPDMVISDLYMPGMTGFELLSVLRRRFPSVPVVAMSSAFSAADVPPGLAADAYYEKATSTATLLRLIEAFQKEEDRLATLRPRVQTPVWIELHSEHEVPELDITLSCPECLRTFEHPAKAAALAVSDAQCIFCGAVVPYALVQTVVTETSRAAAQAKEFLVESLKLPVPDLP
jgi:CheY-like chemotaxis protein